MSVDAKRIHINESCTDKITIGDIAFFEQVLQVPLQAKLLRRVWQLIQDWLGSILDRISPEKNKVFELHPMFPRKLQHTPRAHPRQSL